MRTEARPVVEPTVIPSATNCENAMPATQDSSEPTPVPGTDETQDRESLLTWKPMIPTRLQLFLNYVLFRNLFLRHRCHRIYGKREAAVAHERSVRPRIELLEEDELFVYSQLQSFREQVQEHVSDHGVVKGLELTLSLRILWVKISKQRPNIAVICIVSPMIKVLNSHLTCRGTIWKNSSKTEFLT